MYEFLAVPDVRPEELTDVCHRHQVEGYSVEQIDPYSDGLGVKNQIRYAVVFKRTVPEQSYGQMLVNRAYDKVREVRDALAKKVGDPSDWKALMVADLDKFLFDGSPEDR